MDYSKEVVYKLQFPIVDKISGTDLKEITLKRPKGKHIKHLPLNPNTAELMDVAARVSGIAPPTLDELDVKDYMAVVDIVANFFMSTQVTGTTS